MITGRKIWDCSCIPDRETTRIEFIELIRFNGQWFSAFREGDIHSNSPSGRARILRSHDGEQWETVTVFDWDGGDVREPKLSITPEGRLLMNTSLYFVSREPQEDGTYRILPPINACLNLHNSDEEHLVAQQSVNWLSADGETWSSAYACPSGVNTWRWDVDWHDGMGYSLAQWGRHPMGALYRTRDGQSWRLLRDEIFPPGHAGEGALAFGDDGTAYCLLRGSNAHGCFLGKGKAPFYQEWEWTLPTMDYGKDRAPAGRADEVLRVGLGGPKLIRLSDGRFIGAGRALGPGNDDGVITLYWVEPEENRMTLFAELAGPSYTGLAEYDGQIWATHGNYEASAAYLAKMDIPDAGRLFCEEERLQGAHGQEENTGPKQ